MQLSVPVISHSKRDVSSQTDEVLSFSLPLRQLQVDTQAKAQLEQELVLEQEGLAKNHEDQHAKMTEEQEDQQTRMAQEQEDQWFQMAQKQEDQWASMAEQVDTTFREVLFQMRKPIW